MGIGKTLIFAIFVVAIASLAGCMDYDNKGGKTVVFDVAHRPIFSEYSELKKVLSESGLRVVEGDVQDLDEASAYILMGPAHSVDEHEIVDFVEDGGILFIAIHIPPSNLENLLEEFGFEVEKKPIERQVVTGRPAFDHILTRGIDEITMYGCFRVSNPIIVEKRETVSFSSDENMGIVGFKQFGKGYVIIAGDDAAFTDTYIKSSDNRKLIENLAEFIKSQADK